MRLLDPWTKLLLCICSLLTELSLPLSLVKVGCFLIYRGEPKLISWKYVFSSNIAVSAVPLPRCLLFLNGPEQVVVAFE
jgi:hypothetical protein